MRFNHSSYGFRGQLTRQRCAGSDTVSSAGGGVAHMRSAKSPIQKSDFLKPTAYKAFWVGEHMIGMTRAEQAGDLCSDGRGNFYYRKLILTNGFSFGPTPELPGFSNFSIVGTQSPVATWTYAGLNRVADMALLAKIKDQKLDLGVLLGEAKETAELFVDLTEDLLSMVKFIKTGKRDPLGFMHYLLTKDKRDLLNGKPHWPSYERKYKRHMSIGGVHRYKDRRFSKQELTFLGVTSQAAANRWMQYRYGMIPVYNDIISIFDYLVMVSQTEPLITSRVTIPMPKLASVSVGTNLSTIETEHEGFQQVKVWYKVSDPKVRNSVQLGIDSLSLPATIWELTPFSFMIDWAFPIGASLSALNATRGLTFYCGYRSMRSEVKTKAVHSGGILSNGVLTMPTQPAKASYGAFERVTLASFPSVHPPVLENPFGYHTGQRIIDCISLLRQFINFK